MLDEVFDPFSLYNYCSPALGEHFFAGVAQLVEQLIRNQQVSGSSPVVGSLMRNGLPGHLKTQAFSLWEVLWGARG